MSKLLKKDLLREDSSYHISQMKTSTDSLIATHAADDDAHQAVNDDIMIQFVGVDQGALLGYFDSHPAVIFPAADNNARGHYSGFMSLNATAMVNPTLYILFTTSGGADTATFLVRADASKQGQASTGENLTDASHADFTTGAPNVFTLHTISLVGTISPGDVIGVMCEKTSIDTRSFNLNPTLWIKR